MLSLILVACGQDSPTPSPTITTSSAATASASPTIEPAQSPLADAATPEGWQRISVAEAGFSLAVPDAWQELSPDVIGDSGVIEDMLEANPDAAGALEQAQAAIASGQIALFAFDATDDGIDSGFATNLNAINVGGPVEGTAEQAAEEVAEAVRQQIPIIGEVGAEAVSLPAGDAALVRYQWEVADAEGTATRVAVTQYAIIASSGTGFILSMSAASDIAERYAGTFRQIAESFREEAS